MLLPNCLRPGRLLLLLCMLCVAGLQAQEGDQDALEAGLQQYLPRLLPKLQRRARIRVTVVGDSISNFYQPGETKSPSMNGVWYDRFLARLAGQFFYTGGVREDTSKPVLKVADPLVDFTDVTSEGKLPPRGEVPRLDVGAPGGPEILLRNFSRNGAVSMQALQVLTTEGFDDDPDLVIWMFGSFDASARVPVERFREALAQVIKLSQGHHAGLIIAGPPLIYGKDPGALPMTQPYVEAARSLAKEAKILFADMSAALGRVPLLQPADPETVLSAYLDEVGKFYTHHGKVDRFHPNPLGHEIMADAVWQALQQKSPPEPLQPRGSWTLPDKAGGESKFEITVFQPATEALPPPPIEGVVVSVLPQPGGWQRVGGPSLTVKDFTGKRMTVIPMEPIPGGAPQLPLGETSLATVVLHEGTQSRLANVALPILPVTLGIPVSRMDGVSGSIAIESVVQNRLPTEMHAAVSVAWLESHFKLDLAIGGGASKPLKLRLPLPDAPLAHGPLRVTIQTGGQEFVFERMIDATQAFQPGQRYELRNSENTAPAPAISMHADAAGLYCHFELPPAKPTSGAPVAAVVSLAIDARAPAEMALPGYVDRWNFDIPWTDGPLKVRNPRPAIFGNGYDRVINPASIRASLKTESNGRRIVNVDIPRNDFYLHQWSLATNGQNTLGIDASVSLLDASTSPPGFSPALYWSLMRSGFHGNDAGGLGVLQLTPGKSGTWSVRIY